MKDFLQGRRWRAGALAGLLDTSALVLAAFNADGAPMGASPVPCPIFVWAASGASFPYVTNVLGNTGSVLNLATNTVIGGPSVAAGSPTHMAFSPDGARACVINGCGLNGCVGAVSVLDLATNSVIGAPIVVGSNPAAVAITPDGSHAYVVNEGDCTVSVIDLATNTVIGRPISVGRLTFVHQLPLDCSVAITPDGARAYVTIEGDYTVSVIELATNRVIRFPMAERRRAWKVAIARDGARAFVGNDSSVSVIDLATNTVIGAPIAVSGPDELAITPNGTRGCVLCEWRNGVSVSVIDLATNAMIGSPIALGVSHRINRPFVAIAPDGARAYVTNMGYGTVSVIDLIAKTVIGSPIELGKNIYDVAITPDGARAYVTNTDDGTVSVIDLATNTLIGSPIAVGSPLSAREDRRAAATARLGSIETAVADLLTAGSLNRSQADILTKRVERARKTAAKPCALCDSDPGYYNRDLTQQLVD